MAATIYDRPGEVNGVRVGQGNTFALMRLALPEHRELVKRRAQASKERIVPVYDQDHWDEVGQIIGEAIAGERPVQIFEWDPANGTKTLCVGIVRQRGVQMFIETPEGVRRLEPQRIVGVEWV